MAYHTISSFSGSDMLVHFVLPDTKPILIGTASTVTYSLFREKRQVRTLGRISPKGYTKGPRTVGGTLIFTVIEQNVINDLMDALKNIPIYQNYDRIKPDELPPFDIVLTFGNEFGQVARKVIYGVTIVDDAGTFSIEDLFSENQMTYLARDIDHMRAAGKGHRSSTADVLAYAKSAGFKWKADEWTGIYGITPATVSSASIYSPASTAAPVASTRAASFSSSQSYTPQEEALIQAWVQKGYPSDDATIARMLNEWRQKGGQS